MILGSIVVINVSATTTSLMTDSSNGAMAGRWYPNVSRWAIGDSMYWQITSEYWTPSYDHLTYTFFRYAMFAMEISLFPWSPMRFSYISVLNKIQGQFSLAGAVYSPSSIGLAMPALALATRGGRGPWTLRHRLPHSPRQQSPLLAQKKEGYSVIRECPSVFGGIVGSAKTVLVVEFFRKLSQRCACLFLPRCATPRSQPGQLGIGDGGLTIGRDFWPRIWGVALFRFLRIGRLASGSCAPGAEEPYAPLG